MTEAAQHTKKWEGQTVDGIFPLLQFLGETEHSAVFLTEYIDGETTRKAAIKLVPAEETNADLQLASWNFAAHMAHPNLLQLFRSGRCKLDGEDLLYLAMEYAEEDLADILPQRALTAEETRDMLLPVLDALEYLHGKSLVHRDIKPANILATGDQLKLSSDAISRVGEGLSVAKKAGVYDPPEAISGVLSPAGDVWALGTTLVEVLTQKLPDWQPGPHREPVVPATIPPPFAEIARQCLRLEPDRRIRVADIAARLNPRAAAAAASASYAMPASGAGLKPIAATAPTLPAQKPVIAMPASQRPESRIPVSPSQSAARPGAHEETRARRKFIVPLIIGAIAFALLLTIPRMLTHRSAAQTTEDLASNKPSSEPVAAKAAPAALATKPITKPEQVSDARGTAPVTPRTEQRTAQQAAVPPAADSVKTASEKEQPTPDASAAVSTPVPPVATAQPAAARVKPGKGEVLDQVLPDVSQKARDTIHGSVRVSVKVHVDAAGAVSDAEFDSTGPSKFFADAALQAARRWAFTPPEVDGKSVPSEWVLRFVFTQTDTRVTPTQTAP